MKGGDIGLNCTAEAGVPKPQLTWKFRGAVLERENEDADLASISVKNVSRERDEGAYVCLAVNEYGSDQNEIKIQVRTFHWLSRSHSLMPLRVLFRSLSR